MKPLFTQYTFGNLPPFSIGTDADSTDAYSEYVRTGLAFEAPIQLAAAMLEPGQQFVDMGANVGHFTLSLAGTGAQVFAIEALPKNYALLTMSVRENRYRNVTPVHAAVTSYTGTLHMDGTSAWGWATDRPTSMEVPCFRPDDLLEAYGFDRPSLIKMDIEGSERAALQGGTRVFGADTDLAVIFEANAYASVGFGYGVADLMKVFEDLGFQLFMFLEGQLIPRRSTDFQETIYTDYLAVRDVRRIPAAFAPREELSPDERAAFIVREASSVPPAHRAYVWAMQDRIPEELKRNPHVAAALEALSRETNEEFLNVVAAFRRK